MATIHTAIQIADRVTQPINNMISAVNALCGAFEDVDEEIIDGFDTSRIQAARAAVEQAARQTSLLADEQDDYNRSVQRGVDGANQLAGTLKKAVGFGALVAAAKKTYDFAMDAMSAYDTQLNAETQLATVLTNMVDEEYILQVQAEMGSVDDVTAALDDVSTITIEANTEAVRREFDALTAKAAEIQGRGIYGDEIMIAGAAELSTYFTDTDALEMMMDTLANYAMGMSGGGELSSEAMVNYATGLGKMTAGAYDSMTKKGFEVTDAQRAIIEGTATEAEYAATLGDAYADMSEDMRAAVVISQIIDESWAGMYETMSSTPQGKLIKLNNLWGDMKEKVGNQLYPAVGKLVDKILDNWDDVEEIMNNAAGFVEGLTELLGWLLELVIEVGEYTTANWDTIAPIVLGVAAAFVTYNGVLATTKVAAGLVASAQSLLNGTMSSASLASGTAAIAIGLLVAGLGMYVNKTNEACDTSLSLAGVIGGALFVTLSVFGNLVITTWNLIVDAVSAVWNLVLDLADFLGNVFIHPLSSILHLFANVFGFILDIVIAVGDAITTLFNVDKWQVDAVRDFKNTMLDAVDETYGELDSPISDDLRNVVENVRLEPIDYDEAYQAGYDLAEEMFGGFNKQNDIYSTVDDIFNKMNEGISDTADNTGRAADALEITDEDMKYLRDIAERDTINRFTTAELNLNLGGITNNVSGDTDLDGMVDYLATNLQDAMVSAAEGVHD